MKVVCPVVCVQTEEVVVLAFAGTKVAKAKLRTRKRTREGRFTYYEIKTGTTLR